MVSLCAILLCFVAEFAVGHWSEGNGLGPERIPQRFYLGKTRRGLKDGGVLDNLRVVGDWKQQKDGKVLELGVIWSNIPYPSAKDWVGVFACSDGEDEESCSPVNRYPVQFKEPQKTLSGKGELTFRVVVRPGVTGYRFAYVGAQVPAFPEVKSITPVVSVPEKLLKLPTQIRVSLVDSDPSAMRIMWSESPAFWSAKDLKSMKVLFGEKQQFYDRSQPALRSYSYDASELCDRGVLPASSIGWVTPGLQVETIIRDLKPNTRYFYVIEHSASGSRSKELSFVSSPTVGQPFKMVVFGDMGQSMSEIDGSLERSWTFQGKGQVSAPNTTKLVRHLVEEFNASLVNHIGDISYAVGSLGLWDLWLTDVEAVSAQVPYMVAIGNHEMGWSKSDVPGTDSQGECGRPYSTFFPFSSQHYSLPTFTEDQQTVHTSAWKQPWYSYNFGIAHIAVISTEHNFNKTSAQYLWLEEDLRKVSRSSTPWLILMGHRPMVISTPFGSDKDFAASLQTTLGPLLSKYKVDLAFWGHHHSYQRTHIIDGVRHIVVGSAGASFSPLNKADERFAYLNNDIWGVSFLELFNRTSARVRFFDNNAYGVHDDAWIEVDRKEVYESLDLSTNLGLVLE